MSSTVDSVPHYPTIHKDPAAGPFNMVNYDRLYRDFKWEDMAGELGLPRANGVNKATICIDGHPPEVMKRIALLWHSIEGEKESYTFEDLRDQTNKFANVLTDLGVE